MRTVSSLFRRKRFQAVLAGCLLILPVAWVIFWFLTGIGGKPEIFRPGYHGKNITDLSASWRGIKPFRKLRGVALVVHGLNMKPERMDSIIQCLNRNGIDVLNIALKGHGGNYHPIENLTEADARLESFRTVDYTLWTEEVRSGFDLAKARAQEKRVPLYFVGYSLGGLLGCDLVLRSPAKYFEALILFAPALKIRTESYLLKAIMPFPNLVIDSLSPPWYRANKGTPMAAYKVLFEAIDHLEKNIDQRLNRPALIFMDKEDELISPDGIRDMLARHRLDRWRILELSKDPDVGSGVSHHLIIDQDSMGKRAWKEVSVQIARFLQDH